LKSVNRSYIYVGLTDNIIRRTKQHNEGKNKTTKPYLPFVVILIEDYPSRIEARKREKYLKSGSGKEFLKTLLNK
jgi:putative endonuclease